MTSILFKRLHPKATLPAYAHPGDAGMDLCSCEKALLNPGERKVIKTGWSISLPEGTEAQIRPRSGLALKNGITVLNAPGTIDQGYRGEIGVILVNLGSLPFSIEPGMRIAQMVIAPVLHVDRISEEDKLPDSERGTGGFGSTGL